jgi:hypothetical protein
MNEKLDNPFWVCCVLSIEIDEWRYEDMTKFMFVKWNQVSPNATYIYIVNLQKWFYITLILNLNLNSYGVL